MMFVRLQEWEKAKEDLTTARDKQENIIIEQFRKEYENVADFEQKHEIKLPEDIAAMLTPSSGETEYGLLSELPDAVVQSASSVSTILTIRPLHGSYQLEISH